MASDYKVLGQSDPSATTLTDVYTVPGSSQAVISTIVVANRDPGNTTYRISIAPAGAADSDEQYIAYNIPISGNTSQTLTLGITLDTTDVVRVYATLATLSFNVFGTEIS